MATGEPSVEQQLRILKEELWQAQKMTALGELASTTVHEFNNVLTTIINYAKIGMRHQDAATRDKAFERILTAGDRAAKIANGVLGFARNRGSSHGPTELVELVDETLLLLEREMRKHRVVVEKQVESVPKIWANGNQIQQVLLNFMVNAQQAMPQGGRMVIRVTYDEASRMVDLMIRDTGCGIPPEKIRHIFDRFFTTKTGPDSSGRGGTGLGLAMCRDIIEAHRGRIRVESGVGKGTAFTLRLPVAEMAHPRIDVPVSPVSELNETKTSN